LLVAHIDDATPTKLVVGGNGEGEFRFMWRVFRSEHDDPFREEVKKMSTREMLEGDYVALRKKAEEEFLESRKKERSFKGPYTVKVGDVCFALIGQILGRPYAPVGYRPTAGLVVNSPIESPELAEWVRRDWKNFDKQKHLEVLLKDARLTADDRWGAGASLERLRFYFPDEYAKQAKNGDLKTAIETFEEEGKGRLR
jgi:hypothetical protein